MASETLTRLHWQANNRMSRSVPNWYEINQARWQAYLDYCDGVAAKLPFKWHPVACDNPTQNHTGYTNGTTHIVLDEAYDAGRLHRKPHQALCGNSSPNLWGDRDRGISCKACAAMAENIVAKLPAPTPAEG